MSRFRTNQLLLISLAWIAWSAVCIATSTHPTISFKYWIVDAGHWWVFCLGMAFYPGLWRQILPFFRYSMLGVVVYTMIRHGVLHFRADQALLAPMPFFPDHTMYAAVLAMLVWIPSKPWVRIVEATGLIFSTCRAAWLSLLAACVALSGFEWRKRARLLFLGALLAAVGVFFLAPRVSNSVQRDVSMQERFNRWHCAAQMMAEKPLFGFGPGTFAFTYFPYQRPENLTRISVFQPLTERGPATFGRGGGAHSEFLQTGAETGLISLLIWMALLTGSLWRGIGHALTIENPAESRFFKMLTLGLLTYVLHAFLNNFLHDGRIAFLFWGMFIELSRPVYRETASSVPVSEKVENLST